MSRDNVTGTGGGLGCRAGDHRVRMFELWSSKGSGSGTSSSYGQLLTRRPTSPIVSDEHGAARAGLRVLIESCRSLILSSCRSYRSLLQHPHPTHSLD